MVGTYMATQAALNRKIEEGDENAPTLKKISKEMAKGYLRGKILSGGDEGVAAGAAMTSAIDETVEQLSQSKIKDDWKVLKFISDHKSAIQSTTSAYSWASLLKSWGLSDKVANSIGIAAGGGEYLIDKGVDKVKDLFGQLTSFLSKNEESLGNLNNTLKSNENFLKSIYDNMGLDPRNTAFPLSSAVLPGIQNDNISNSNFVVNNTMTVNGGNPREVQNAVSNATTASLQKFNNMRNSADFVTVGVK